MLAFTGTIGANAGDVVYTSADVSRYGEHIFNATAGALTAEVTVNGTDWQAAVAFTSLITVTPGTPVVVTTSTTMYRLVGKFRSVRFKQSGATPSNVKGAHVD
jgi:hypothetical protein